MFKRNLISSFRAFRLDKSSFFINLIGLSSGLAFAFMIYLWVNDEMEVDHFFKNDNHLLQVLQNVNRSNGIETIEATPGILAKTLNEEMPEVEYAVTVVPTKHNACKGVITSNQTRIQSVGQFVTKDFFNVFSYKLIHGDKDQVLSEKNNIVISEKLALQLFGTVESALGKTIDWKAQSTNGSCLISGVFEQAPSKVRTQFDLLLSYEWYEESNQTKGWNHSSPHSYVLLSKDVATDQFNKKVKGFMKSKDESVTATLFLQKYSDRYLYGNYENGIASGGRIEYVQLFSIIGILLLLIACINFMNLSTAKASRRIKEIGIKKTLGASRKVLVFQHLQESILMTFISLLMAIIIVALFLPQFNEITGKNFLFNIDLNTLVAVVCITVLTGIISGSYPSLYHSGFNPTSVLKGLINTSRTQIWARKSLIVFQFMISITLIVSVLVVYKQIGFVQSNKTLGYDKENVIYFGVEKMSKSFLSELENIPGVLNVGGGKITAGNPLGGTDGLSWQGKKPEDKIFFSRLWGSYNLIETLGIEVVEGRSFSKDYGSHNQIIFNEEAIKGMGLTDPVGKMMKTGKEDLQIVGVVKNFHFESLYEPIKPCALFLAPIEYAPKLSIKIQKGVEKLTIQKIQKVYETYNLGLPFDFKFMDMDNQKLYASEQRVAILSRYFAGITILVSCLGLFGLAAFTAERRQKEIGIRKVLGSGVFNIVMMLTGDFTKMVIIAIIIGLPLSYLVAKEWLDSFVLHIDLEWWFFVGAGLVSLLIAWLTVGFQTYRAASINPAKCLKDE